MLLNTQAASYNNKAVAALLPQNRTFIDLQDRSVLKLDGGTLLQQELCPLFAVVLGRLWVQQRASACTLSQGTGSFPLARADTWGTGLPSSKP